MSVPTRGMVAGQTIQTQAQTKEFDAGYERTFGQGSKQRGRFVWSEEKKAMVQVGADWTDKERRAATVTEELVYGKLGTAQDGAPINSRKRHREYMKKNGLALTSDFSDNWRNKLKAERAREDTADRRETVARAVYRKFKP